MSRLGSVFAIALAGTVTALVPACDGEVRLDADPVTAADGGGRADGGPEANASDSRWSACSTGPDCPLSSLHCEPVAGACVPCLVDAHCARKERRRCDTASHRCVQCGLSTDCEDAEGCEPITHRCVRLCGDGGACPSDAPTCDLRRGLCIGCTVDGACRSGDKPFCENASGMCVECLSDENCSSSSRPRCDHGTAKCVQCLAASDCPGDKPVCDPDPGECVKP